MVRKNADEQKKKAKMVQVFCVFGVFFIYADPLHCKLKPYKIENGETNRSR